MKRLLVLAIILLGISFQNSQSCTNFLITRGASKDGSTMITYAADSHVLYGELYSARLLIIPKVPCWMFMNGIQENTLVKSNK